MHIFTSNYLHFLYVQYYGFRHCSGVHGLMFLDVDETIECLLNTCPDIYCGLAADLNWLKR